MSHLDARKTGSIAAITAGILVAVAVLAAEPVQVVVLEPGAGKLETLLEREGARAEHAAKVPFVELTAEWCAPCKALRASLGDPLMRDAFAGTYIIQVDVDAWRDELAKAGFEHPAIPVFFAIDSSGRPLGPKIDGGAWGKDIPRNMAPPLTQFFRANRATAD